MSVNRIVAAGLIFCTIAALGIGAKTPPAAEMKQVTTDLAGRDAAVRQAAVEKIKGWIDTGWVSQSVWRT